MLSGRQHSVTRCLVLASFDRFRSGTFPSSGFPSKPIHSLRSFAGKPLPEKLSKNGRTKEENRAKWGHCNEIAQESVDTVFASIEKTGCSCMRYQQMGEGTRADAAIWCTKYGSDFSVGIQVKCDKQPTVRPARTLAYHFSDVNKYPGMPVINVALDGSDLCWFLSGSDLMRLKSDLTTSAVGGKYEKNKVSLRFEDESMASRPVLQRRSGSAGLPPGPTRAQVALTNQDGHKCEIARIDASVNCRSLGGACCDAIHSASEDYQKNTLAYWDTPVSKTQKIEMNTRNALVPFVNYCGLTLSRAIKEQGTTSDFYLHCFFIDGPIRVQQKASAWSDKGTVNYYCIATVSKSCGIGRRQPFVNTDFDILWVPPPNYPPEHPLFAGMLYEHNHFFADRFLLTEKRVMADTCIQQKGTYTLYVCTQEMFERRSTVPSIKPSVFDWTHKHMIDMRDWDKAAKQLLNMLTQFGERSGRLIHTSPDR
eukprot:GDKI01012544.1.p1 GENE.GDKI01012544.1~~GDKI01012544.1.p1  ORF type:complete len:480 (-),score=1.82 GDKI01012544.1:248-1687(-)